MAADLDYPNEELLHNSLAGLNNVTFYMSTEEEESKLSPLEKNIIEGSSYSSKSDQPLNSEKF